MQSIMSSVGNSSLNQVIAATDSPTASLLPSSSSSSSSTAQLQEGPCSIGGVSAANAGDEEDIEVNKKEAEGLPGNGHVFGNFNNYYSFHPPSDRTNLFPKGFVKRIWESANRPRALYLLDIGCNEGWLSLDMMRIAANDLSLQFGVHIYMLGVDIDPLLISKANRNLIKFMSQIPELSEFCHATFEKCDILRDLQVIEDYKQSHIAKEASKSSGFDIVFLFSITMWVHLTNGDDGLNQFIDTSCHLTRLVLIVEPQNWSSYKSAMKRCRHKHIDRDSNFKPISIKGDTEVKEHINSLITLKSGLQRRIDFGTDTWSRSIIGFHRPDFEFSISDLISSDLTSSSASTNSSSHSNNSNCNNSNSNSSNSSSN